MQDTERNTETAIEPINLANDYFLANEMSSLERSVLAAAQNTVANWSRNEGIPLTDTELEAVVTVQVLHELNSVDLATLLLRYKYVRMIRDRGLTTRHPAGYQNYLEPAAQAGISASEMSRIIDLVEIVFPYLGGVLMMDVPALWKEVGKSNFFDMLPVLKVLITGEDVDHSRQANEAAARFLDDAAIGYINQGMEVPNDEDLRGEVVQDIVNRGTLLNNRELRVHLRPERTPSIETHVFMNNGEGFVLMPITNDQMTMLARRAGVCIDVTMYNDMNEIYQAAYSAPVRNFLRTLGMN